MQHATNRSHSKQLTLREDVASAQRLSSYLIDLGLMIVIWKSISSTLATPPMRVVGSLRLSFPISRLISEADAARGNVRCGRVTGSSAHR